MSTVAIIVIIAVVVIAVIAGLGLGMARRRTLRQQLRPLSEAARESYLAQWPAIQERFVDQPDLAVNQARELVTSVLQDRGHPAESYQQITSDLAAGYPEMAGHFKSAHRLSHQLSPSAANGAAPTEDLRQALINYRAAFDELLGGTQEFPASSAIALEQRGQGGTDVAGDDVVADEEPVSGPVSDPVSDTEETRR